MSENKKNIFDLTGKVAIVTGGAGWLGRAECEGLAEQGATVVIASRDIAKCEAAAHEIASETGARAVGMMVDVLRSSTVVSLFARVVEEFGQIDVLVNNASSSTMGYFDALDDEKWAAGIDGTLNSAARCARLVLPHMLKRGRGKIISVASMYGMTAPDPAVYKGDPTINNPANYGAAKAGLIQLTKYIASYYGRSGITANAVSPGPFPKDTVQSAHPEFVAALAERTMLGRLGKPSDLKGIFAFLASDASDFITGQNFAVDGGWTAR